MTHARCPSLIRPVWRVCSLVLLACLALSGCNSITLTDSTIEITNSNVVIAGGEGVAGGVPVSIGTEPDRQPKGAVEVEEIEIIPSLVSPGGTIQVRIVLAGPAEGTGQAVSLVYSDVSAFSPAFTEVFIPAPDDVSVLTLNISTGVVTPETLRMKATSVGGTNTVTAEFDVN